MTNENQNKVKKRFIFKVNPGVYGEGSAKPSPDDLIEMKLDANDTEVPIPLAIQIYHRKKNFFLSPNTTINLIFGLCAIVLILLKFIFNDYFLTIHEKNLETLISNLCFAFIASYIFYNVVTKSADKTRKREAFAIICGLTESLINQGKKVLELVSEGADEKNNFDNIKKLDKKQFKDLCSKVDFSKIKDGNNIGNLIISHGVKQVNFYIDKIFQYAPFLEGELLHSLIKIQNCKFSRFIIMIPFKENQNLNEFSNDIIEYSNYIQELEIFNNKVKNKYLKKYELKY